MDKEKEQHLKEYNKELGYLQHRIGIMRDLIAKISEEEEIHPAEHDFPNYAKYNKGTDI